MLYLKHFAQMALDDKSCIKDYTLFRTLGFDPEELLQLRDMNNEELKGLMMFCGIRVYKRVPLIVMEKDEMRMAYLEWRANRIEEKKAEVKPKVERGVKWINYLQQAVEIMVNR